MAITVQNWVAVDMFVPELILELPELGIIRGLYAKDSTAEDQKLAHYGDGRCVNLPQRLDEKKAHGGNHYS